MLLGNKQIFKISRVINMVYASCYDKNNKRVPQPVILQNKYDENKIPYNTVTYVTQHSHERSILIIT